MSLKTRVEKLERKKRKAPKYDIRVFWEDENGMLYCENEAGEVIERVTKEEFEARAKAGLDIVLTWDDCNGE